VDCKNSYHSKTLTAGAKEKFLQERVERPLLGAVVLCDRVVVLRFSRSAFDDGRGQKGAIGRHKGSEHLACH
jgi:hypothetical protein